MESKPSVSPSTHSKNSLLLKEWIVPANGRQEIAFIRIPLAVLWVLCVLRRLNLLVLRYSTRLGVKINGAVEPSTLRVDLCHI